MNVAICVLSQGAPMETFINNHISYLPFNVSLIYGGRFPYKSDGIKEGLFAKSFERQIEDIFGHGSLKKIPNNHKIYSSFFEFEKGPPTTSQELNGWGDDLVHDYLKAIEVDERIGVLYSNKDYGCEWDYDFRNKRWYKIDNTRFAVNIVMYALTS